MAVVVSDLDPDPGGGDGGGSGNGAVACSITEVANYACPSGYILWNNACVNTANSEDYFKIPHAVGYDVEYYEHGGELVSKYNLMGVDPDGCTVPVYFDQNVKS